MSEDYTFLRNDQLKIMEDELESGRAYIKFLQDTVDTLDYELSVYKNALDILSIRTNVIDRTNGHVWGDVVWSSKHWKEWAIKSAKESMEVKASEEI